MRDVQAQGYGMTERVQRRRESDRAEERASQAAKFGDYAAFVMASAKADAARRRREDWVEDQAGKR
jgi:hypothetical protein